MTSITNFRTRGALGRHSQVLKPDGRLVLVEFRAEDPDVPIKPEHKMALKQVRKEVEPRGYKFVESLEFLPWQHIIIFERGKDKEKEQDKAKVDCGRQEGRRAR